MPEGFSFSWMASDGHNHKAPLLTPPDFEAVQREDGSWYRVPRMAGGSVPSPYSKAWYKEYLRTHGLPEYFLRPRHLAMLLDNEESEHLQVPNVPSPTLAVAPSRDYLQRRYSASPLWPQPGTKLYRLDSLSDGARAGLVRYHPGLLVKTFTYNVYVFPDAHLELRLPGEALDCQIVYEDDARWARFDDRTSVPSSYHQESTGLHILSHANQASTRDALIQAAVNEHALINPMEDIPGLGELTFLSEGERLEAQRRGYTSARQVSMARRRGDLAVGTGTNAGPLVVFRPDQAMLNPREQPSGAGAWRFLTSAGETSNAGLAAIQFGGSRGLPAYPSARQIRRLGQLFREAGRTDLTRQIDIVWVPGAVDDEIAIDPVLEEVAESEEEEEEEEEEDEKDEEDDEEADEESLSSTASLREASQMTLPYTDDGLIFDPTNNNGVRGGVYDQTGEWAEYQTTLRHGDRCITIDRSRAWYDTPEPHKLWCYSYRGWRKWPHAHSMDWKDKSKVNALNKHREQTHQRAKWPRVRGTKRPDYKKEEREFVMDYVKAAEGKRAGIPMEKLREDFHRRFLHRDRNDTGMQSLVDRLRTEYRLHGGLMARRKRGWRQTERSQASRGISRGSQPRGPRDGSLGPLFNSHAESQKRVQGEEQGEEQEQSEDQDESEPQEHSEVPSGDSEESEEESDEADKDIMIEL